MQAAACRWLSSKLWTSESLRRTRPKLRSFQNRSEFLKWREDVENSRLRFRDTSKVQSLEISDAAPFLHSVSPIANHLHLLGIPDSSLLQCLYPLSSNELLRNSVTDFSNWSSFRLGKFYEIVDALTADVGYRHCNEMKKEGNEVTLVTAGHYHSRKFHRTDIQEDVTLRCYVTYVGKSSLEIRTDALQYNESVQDDILVNVCHTVMVALDKETQKSIGKSGLSLPKLENSECSDAKIRTKLAEKHQRIRLERNEKAMQLRARSSAPPTSEEMLQIHNLHRAEVSVHERNRNLSEQDRHFISPRVSDYTFRSSTVIFPEKRNVHGKLFGGFIMDESQKLAQYAATFLSKGEPIVSLGIDEAIFAQPISIGDCLTFTARCVHSTKFCCRVLVSVEVRDPVNRDWKPKLKNRLMFVFGASNLPKSIVPDHYSEILKHIDANRRYEVEGPTDIEVENILEESVDLKSRNGTEI